MVAAWLGAVASVVIGGAGTLLVAALWIYWFPALWKVDRLTTGDDTETSAPTQGPSSR